MDALAPFSDFALTTSPGITGVFVTGVTPISGTEYTVSVNPDSGTARSAWMWWTTIQLWILHQISWVGLVLVMVIS